MTENALSTIQEFDFSAIDRADLAPSTKHQYKKAVSNFIASGGDITDPESLAEYAGTVSRSSRAFLKAAIRMMARQYATNMKGRATPGNIQVIQAALLRLEAVQEAIKVRSVNGSKFHLWLNQSEVRHLMASCGDDLVGKRDWVVLGLLVGAGLRREELVSLRFSDLKIQTINGNGDKRPVLEIKGKGSKGRVIPIKPVLAERIEEWRQIAGDGLVVRSLGRKKVLGDSISAIGVFKIVRKHGKAIGKPELAPHDLRRTFAQLGYEAGITITQISVLLGHDSVATTEKYLDLHLDFENTVSDFIPLE